MKDYLIIVYFFYCLLTKRSWMNLESKQVDLWLLESVDGRNAAKKVDKEKSGF